MTKVKIDTSKWIRGQYPVGQMIDEAGNICFLGWLLLAMGLSKSTVKNYNQRESVIMAAIDKDGRLVNKAIRSTLVAINDVKGLADHDRMMMLSNLARYQDFDVTFETHL